MKKLVCKILTLSLILSSLPFAASCSDSEEEGEKLKYYYAEGYYCQLDEDLIKRYNNFCQNNYDESYKIEMVAFESEDDMYTKMSAELMSGGGPDIFSLDQCLPFEKLMRSDSLADINELIENDASNDKLDLSEYNQAIMQAGQYNNRQYIIPVFFDLNVLTSTEKNLQEYDLPIENGMTLTYCDIPSVFEKYFEDSEKIPFMYADGISLRNSPQEMLYRLVRSYVDFEKNEVYFDTEDFSKSLDSMMNIFDCYSDDWELMYSEDNRSLFDAYSGSSFTQMAQVNHTAESKGNKKVFYNGFNRNSNDISATVELGVAINANSKHKDKALAFIKYLLSEDFQEYYCGDKNPSVYAGSNVISHPVRDEAFKNSIESAASFDYYYEYEEDGVIKDEEYEINGIDNEYMQGYINSAENVNSCSLYYPAGVDYYSRKVIDDILNDYLSGTISKKKFVQQLTNATKIYMTE